MIQDDEPDEDRDSWYEFEEPAEPLESAERRLDDPRHGQAKHINQRIQ